MSYNATVALVCICCLESVKNVSVSHCRMEIITPKDHVGTLMELCQGRRGEFIDMQFLTETRTTLIYELPLANVRFQSLVVCTAADASGGNGSTARPVSHALAFGPDQKGQQGDVLVKALATNAPHISHRQAQASPGLYCVLQPPLV